MSKKQPAIKTPNPGSKEAIKLGCTCPVMDNANGQGIKIEGKVMFWYNGYCKLHVKGKDNDTQ